MTTVGANPESLPVPYSTKRHGVTITNCDAEPVQTPGCIQPHGVLVVLRPGDFKIIQVSENSERWLGASADALLGKHISSVIGDAATRQLSQFIKAESLDRNPVYAFAAPIENSSVIAQLDLTVHTSDGFILVEFEATCREASKHVDYYSLLKRATGRLQNAGTLAEFCKVAADEVRAVTGLDRVMVYRFQPDASGQVFAESKRDDLHSWLGHRYPADDIPRPARDIFKKIGVRPLPDSSAKPIEMVPLVNPDTGRPLDMTYCALRGASIMYTEYLQNMGVAATLTMPVLRDGQLWGLIACHHYTSTMFPYPVRSSAELLGQVVSLQLKNAEQREHLEYRKQMDAIHHSLLARAAHEGGLAAMSDGNPSLMNGIHCGGIALYHRDKWWTLGKVPSPSQLDSLAGWLLSRPEMHAPARPVLATDSLKAQFADAGEYSDSASGLLAVPLSRGHRNLICWFRPEQVQTFTWAGNPYEKPTTNGPNGPRLTPRKSFDLWQEQVIGHAVPWNEFEIESALNLRYLVMDLVVSRAEQLASLNLDLVRSNEELDSFAYVASHDLKEPLRGIHKYAYHLMEQAQSGLPLDEQAMERLESLLRLTLRMDGLIDSLLHFSKIGRLKRENEANPLDAIIKEAVEMIGARIEESGVELRIAAGLPTLLCDRVRVREIFSNLISNSIKYNDKADKWVEIGCSHPTGHSAVRPRHLPSEVKDQDIFYVRDNGIGIDSRHFEQVFKMFKRLHTRDAFGGGTGAGLAIVKKLVTQHGGAIWIESTVGEGTTFFFTLMAEVQTSGK